MQYADSASPNHRRRGQGGLTILEIVISMVVLSVATLFSLSVTVSSVSLDKVNREESSATAIVRRITEELRAVPFNQLFASFNGDPTDDPAGPGTAVGDSFTLVSDDQGNLVNADALAVTSDPTTSVHPHGGPPGQRGRSSTRQNFRRIAVDVTLSFPTNGANALDETVQLAMFGNRTWDLNGDGAITAGSRNADYKMLPVVMRLQWNGASGGRVFEVAQVLSDL